jgi:polyisoprenyl-teichoic acid--peptidoglycan teichoic acid transferase
LHSQARRVDKPHSASVATFLSFVWPGLGQAYTGRRRAAAIYGLPLLAFVLIVLLQATGGLGAIAEIMLSPTSALTVAILIGLLGLWRLVSMADAASSAGTDRRWYRGRTGAVFATLAVLVLVIHGWAAGVAYAFYEAGSEIYVSEENPDQTAVPNPASPNPSDDYGTAPFPTPGPAGSRINVLLTGIDAAPTRTQELTDTLMVASIDPETGSVALISFPRDLSGIPLYDGRTFKGKINGLMAQARAHPNQYPDGPMPTVARELGYLLGVPIHYYAAIDLEGFATLIDEVGGVTVNNEKALNDPRYRWLDGHAGFTLSAGVHHLDGKTALAYVRSRQGAGDNDFNRARRQQQVLLALRDKLVTPEMLARAPDLIRAFGHIIKTNFPPDQTGNVVNLAMGMDRESVRQVVLGPTKYAYRPPASETGGVYELRLDLKAVAKLAEDIFGPETAYSQGKGPIP